MGGQLLTGLSQQQRELENRRKTKSSEREGAGEREQERAGESRGEEDGEEKKAKKNPTTYGWTLVALNSKNSWLDGPVGLVDPPNVTSPFSAGSYETPEHIPIRPGESASVPKGIHCPGPCALAAFPEKKKTAKRGHRESGTRILSARGRGGSCHLRGPTLRISFLMMTSLFLKETMASPATSPQPHTRLPLAELVNNPGMRAQNLNARCEKVFFLVVPPAFPPHTLFFLLVMSRFLTVSVFSLSLRFWFVFVLDFGARR
jgi:hypothetical protein